MNEEVDSRAMINRICIAVREFCCAALARRKSGRTGQCVLIKSI
jgi:hypothetical protein